jgi:hypothetical protein
VEKLLRWMQDFVATKNSLAGNSLTFWYAGIPGSDLWTVYFVTRFQYKSDLISFQKVRMTCSLELRSIIWNKYILATKLHAYGSSRTHRGVLHEKMHVLQCRNAATRCNF